MSTSGIEKDDPFVERLNELAFTAGTRIYLTMDGARYDGLPALLQNANLSARSLYRDEVSKELIDVGPWLIDPHRLGDGRHPDDFDIDDGKDPSTDAPEPTQAELEAMAARLADDMKAALDDGDETGGGVLPAADADPNDPRPHAEPAHPWLQIKAALKIAAGQPGLIAWVGNATLTEPQLFRHLRSINRVVMPKAYVEGDVPNAAALEGPDMREENGKAVQFRHADGNVLAGVLPVLDEAQFARMFGPARLLVFTAPDHPDENGHILYEAPLPDSGVAAPAGLLRFSKEQIEGIENARVVRLKGRLSSHLRKVVGPELDETPTDALDAHVETSIRTAIPMGLRSEAAFRRWTHLMYLTRGGIAADKNICAFIRTGTVPKGVSGGPPIPTTADGRMKAAMKETIATLQKKGAA